MQTGDTQANHREAPPSYIPDGDPGRHGGGTYTANSVEPTLEAYENIFGPSARDIKQDLQRFKRHGRWHLPDILKGPNQYLTDRIDGLITDATNSPFTSRILPYKYITNVDGKIKWNVWSFDEGLASRVPYESAARTLQQSKRSYAGYTIRQGMAIVLEHNFMMTEAGRANFKNQLNQLIGSIQLTNDLDVHVALVLAPSYQKTMNERYMTNDKSSTQVCREFVEMFGFVQKNQNALDILIEEAKAQLRTWGAPMPDFMLCNSKLTFQLTMTPDATNYVTQGPEGPKRLKAGPVMQSYRGIGIVHSKAFSMETGTPPRDILRRRVRVAEYYRIPPHKDNHKRLFQLYNEERDTWSTFTFHDLLKKAHCSNAQTRATVDVNLPGHANDSQLRNITRAIMGASADGGAAAEDADEHDSLGSHAALMAADRAPALGRALRVGDVDQSIEANVTELYRQIFKRELRTEFFTDVQFVDSRVVYAPGAMDFSMGDIYDDITGNTRRYPVFIQHALEGIDMSRYTDKERNLGKIQLQSVALYPRAVNSFVTAVTNSAVGGADVYADRFNFPKHFIPIYHQNDAGRVRQLVTAGENAAGSALWQAVVDASTAAVAGGGGNADDPQNDRTAKGTAAGLMLRAGMAVRNFNRYGVPTTLVKRWGGAQSKFQEAFNLGTSTNGVDFPHLDQNLRDRGAFNCPNHFKERDLRFSSIGDLIGYNILVTQELLGSLTSRSNNYTTDEDPSIFLSTFLYDIVQNPDSHHDLLVEVATALNAAKGQLQAAEHAGNPMRRSALTVAVTQAIRTALGNHNRPRAGVTFNQPSRAVNYDVFYWMWPRTTKSEEEVFSERNTQDWAIRIRGMREFTTAYTVDMALATAIRADAGFPTTCEINLAVPLGDARSSTADPETARHFFNMLAWRLWADQEVSLESVYRPGVESWPGVNTFLAQQGNYAHAQFGVGVMNIPQAGGQGYAGAYGAPLSGPLAAEARASAATEHVEVVIVRPNIEHHMLGIILGQGGESLGSTFWGQTELSCYDDSMHGIWGMSYKYNERAIVINERNLVRLWDVAYDGYVGGKDDTSVDWDDNNDDRVNPNSCRSFQEKTMDVTRPYRGPSMMVMAFNHADARRQGGRFSKVYNANFKSNWPSPIVFYDTMAPDQSRVSADFDNIHVVETQQFRVFNNDLYKNGYTPYKERMPDFQELHTIRKNAGLAATENEASSEALAFQGTMRVLSADTGGVIDDVKGSGHHGPDFVGCASLRAGKGYKINSQPTIQRLV